MKGRTVEEHLSRFHPDVVSPYPLLNPTPVWRIELIKGGAGTLRIEDRTIVTTEGWEIANRITKCFFLQPVRSQVVEQVLHPSLSLRRFRGWYSSLCLQTFV